MEQTTNIRQIVDRIRRHPMLLDIPFETVVDYTVDFLKLMATPALYEEKTAIVNIDHWRGMLPCDFYKMIQVRVAPTNHRADGYAVLPPMRAYRYATDTFHMTQFKHDSAMTGELTYKIQGTVIYTSTKDTDVEIAYRAFAVDDEGFPLLPDNAQFMRGLENYIKLQWFTILFDQNKISPAVLYNTQREYAWTVGSAQSEFSRLDLDKAESLFNSFKTILLRNNQHMTGFRNLGAKEIVKRY